MRTRRVRGVILLGSVAWLVLGGFGGCTGKNANPLAGKWIEVTDNAAKMDVEFDRTSDRFQLCTEAGGDGKQGHDDLDGRWAMIDGKVTMTGTWEGNRKTEMVTGALQGDRLTLDLAGGKKVFRRQ